MHICASTHCFKAINILKCGLPKIGNGHGVKFQQTNIKFNGKCQNLQKNPTHFCATSSNFTVIQIKKMLTFKKVGQGHRMQFSQLHHSMANIKYTFCARSYRFRYITISNLLHSESRPRPRSAIFAINLFNGESQNLQMFPTHLFCASSYCF